MSMELRVGELTMIGLRDGDFIMPTRFLGDPDAHRQLADADGIVRLPVGCFLLPGDEPTLIDAGIGPDLNLEMMPGGRLLDEMSSVGIHPDEVRHLALRARRWGRRRPALPRSAGRPGTRQHVASGVS
jgi:hypothetical protein